MNALDIKNIREKLNLTQEKFAELLDVHLRTVQKWEGGETKIRKSTVFLINNLLEKHTKGANEYENNNGNKFVELPNGKYRIEVLKVPFKAYASFIEVFNDEYEVHDDFEKTYFTVDRIGRGKYISFVTANESMNGGGIDDTPGGAEVLGRQIGRHLWQDGFHNSQYGFIIVAKNGIFHKDIVNTDQTGVIMCHSRNPSPEFQPFRLILDDVHSIWKVIKRTF